MSTGTMTACARRCEPKYTGSPSPASKPWAIRWSASRASPVVTTSAILKTVPKPVRFSADNRDIGGDRGGLGAGEAVEEVGDQRELVAGVAGGDLGQQP